MGDWRKRWVEMHSEWAERRLCRGYLASCWNRGHWGNREVLKFLCLRLLWYLPKASRVSRRERFDTGWHATQNYYRTCRIISIMVATVALPWKFAFRWLRRWKEAEIDLSMDTQVVHCVQKTFVCLSEFVLVIISGLPMTIVIVSHNYQGSVIVFTKRHLKSETLPKHCPHWQTVRFSGHRRKETVNIRSCNKFS